MSDILVTCPACGGDGHDTCDNPDHGFIWAVGGETGRLGCPCCGHSDDFKIRGGAGGCEPCGGRGLVSIDIASGFDEERIDYFLEPHEIELIAASKEPRA